MQRILRWVIVLAAMLTASIFVIGPTAGYSRPANPATKSAKVGSSCSSPYYSYTSHFTGFGRQSKVHTEIVANTTYYSSKNGSELPRGSWYGQITLAKGVSICHSAYVSKPLDSGMARWQASKLLVWSINGQRFVRSYRFHYTGKRGVYRTKRLRSSFGNSDLLYYVTAVGQRKRHR
ncbi:MAG TPA: hypothetical protein VLF21_00050 [Candidatus Saccharimonadales bacterium]|nr:hypothetical protein [Candidatus Saccharimonadales bacterium]